MPMNPRLLRPRASAALVAVDADARTYINAVRIADGGQYMEAGVQRAIDNFVIGCKQDGIWSAIKASCLLAGPRTLAGINVPLVGPTPTFNAFTASEYDRKTGLIGNGSTMYIDSGRNNNADPQNNNHNAAYMSAVPTSGTSIMAGGLTNTGTNSILTTASRSRSGTADTGITASSGFIGISRTTGVSYARRVNGSNATLNRTSESPFDANVFVFARNGGAGASFVSNPRLAFYSIGESLDLALLDARVSAYFTAIGAAI